MTDVDWGYHGALPNPLNSNYLRRFFAMGEWAMLTAAYTRGWIDIDPEEEEPEFINVL
jgi:hypothetical protein